MPRYSSVYGWYQQLSHVVKGRGVVDDVQVARVMEERNKTHKYKVIGRVGGHVVVEDGCCARR